MHEQVYVRDIVAQAARHGAVEGITVEVGELAPITMQDIRSALSVTGWEIKLVSKPGKVQCRCGFFGRPVVTEKGHDYTIYHCPRCEAQLPRIVDGKDVVLKDVTVKD